MNSVYKFTCKSENGNLVWTGAPINYKTPANYLKGKAPTGKVDKASNAYRTMYTVGQNFARVSMASDTAKSQCLSAMSSGMIRARGIPQYLGVQAWQLQSYLRTPSGFQGCLDGFGH
jgi:hypothetical protein